MPAREFGYIYFLDAPDVNRIKIGTGVCPEDRLQAIRLMCPVPTKLIGLMVGGRQEEARLHARYADLRRHGEWFEGTPELRHAIQMMCLEDAWNRACKEARDEFLLRIESPIMDERFA